MAAEPICTQMAPYIIQETIGEKWWCACGRSKTQPYCDGSHAGTGFSPVPVKIERVKAVAYCGCRKTGRKPFCDGSHSRA